MKGRIKKLFCGPEWMVCYKRKNEEAFHILKNPKGWWIADPFIFESADRLFLLGEFYKKSKAYGRIGVCEIINNSIRNIKIIIDNGKHMSYPFIVEQKGTVLTIMPETSQNNELCLYSGDVINDDKFGKKQIILSNVKCVDSTIFRFGQKIILLSYSDVEKRSFYYFLNADYSIDGNIHYLSNSLTTRCAGSSLTDKNLLPTQDNTKYYGERILMNSIHLNNDQLLIKQLNSLEPSHLLFDNFDSSKITHLHTYNESENYCVVDVAVNKVNIFRWLEMLRRKMHER